MSEERIEEVKREAADFGGFANFEMTQHEMAFRFCCARGCSYPGYVQLGMPRRPNLPYLRRVLCRSHFVRLVYVQAAFLGDPSPEGEAREIADVLGIGFDPIRDLEGTSVFNPKFARCAACGGGFVAETQGMFKGKRYIHTCGEGTNK